ncbi:MAG TPA: NUDIX hydrolase [Candidatus Pacearchaeota archaeon]|nr:NUDIX hydrolase [Candidatus Pacearchaeota archaeon]HOR52608.1 NUDIX hydrolase [Candidatus Pacearchaeota archaeon]HOU79398.1 NUDIX hydrolase [Candidatus Pacearchaeota archaeon]HPJ87034.1 NUDIX hydrolase [Candidatus Pacearchaeota archaeon]HQF83041.1 NUDIX hydrolase [Candidatus Pacearchaeota archaeon]
MSHSLMNLFFKLVKQKYVSVGVPVIIQNSKGEILLGKRNMNMPTYPGFWGLPGGMPEYGEKIENTAIREVKEELDIDIKIIKKSKNVYENLPDKKCRFHSVDVPFYGKIVKGIAKPKDETKEVKWFKPSEIRNMELAYTHKEVLKGEGLI